MTRRAIRDVTVLTSRNLVHIAREPLRLSDVTIQPVLFTMLCVYVFGAGIVLPGGGSYANFAIAGLLALNLTTSAIGTAVGLSSDLGTGVIERFRTLPMWRPAVLVGRSLTHLLTAALCAAIVALTGLVVGWRPASGVLSTAGAFGVLLLFSYAVSLESGWPARMPSPLRASVWCNRVAVVVGGRANRVRAAGDVAVQAPDGRLTRGDKKSGQPLAPAA